jgi:hypothetical protein
MLILFLRYKDPEHPLRIDKLIKLAGVPHLMLYEKVL